MPVVHTILVSPLGPLLAEADEAGALMRLAFDATPRAGSTESTAPFVTLRNELERYFSGEVVAFSVPVAPHGTDHQQRVWAALREIPYGRTWSYSELAGRAASNPRAVGQANGQNPIAIVVPCHRVVGKDGSLVGYAGGLERKLALLVREGSRWF